MHMGMVLSAYDFQAIAYLMFVFLLGLLLAFGFLANSQ